MTDDYQDKAERELEKWRLRLDKIQADAELLRLDARDRKDAVVADLKGRYEDARAKLRELRGATEGGAAGVKKAFEDAMEAFRASYRENVEEGD